MSQVLLKLEGDSWFVPLLHRWLPVAPKLTAKKKGDFTVYTVLDSDGRRVASLKHRNGEHYKLRMGEHVAVQESNDLIHLHALPPEVDFRDVFF